MNFSDIIGHTKNKNFLKSFYNSGRVPHALLFTGPDGLGKRKAAVAFAAALNCHEPAQEGACGECSSCVRIKNRAHPGIRFVASTKNEGLEIEVEFESENLVIPNIASGKKKSDGAGSEENIEDPEENESKPSVTVKLNIAQVRELKRLSYLKSAAGCRRKVFIVDDASRTSDAAQNSLLKILEEPPSATHLILVTSREEMLLPTVISRCQRIEFSPLSPGEMACFVERREIEAGDELIKISGGSPGKLLEFKELGKFDIPPFEMENVFDAASNWSGEGRRQCIDKLAALLEKEASYFRKSPVPESCRKIEIIEDSIRSLEKNANLDLTVSYMFLELYKLNNLRD